MKKIKRLFAVLLSAALVGQMGVVIGMGSGNGGCSSATHGRTGEKVASAAGCNAPAHWLAGETMTGGNGRNYYYPTGTTSTIQCGTGKNVILFTSDVPQNLTVYGFNAAADEIYVSSVTVKEGWSYSAGELTNSEGAPFVTFDGTAPGSLEIKTLPQAVTAKVTTDNKTVTAEPANNTCLYLWSRKERNVSNSVDTPLDVHSSTVTVDQNIPGEWTYTCVIVDEAGQTSQGSAEVVVGCHVVSDLGEIKVDGAVLTNGAVLETAETRTYALTVEEGYFGSCAVEGHPSASHGYTVKWELTEGGDKVTFADGKLTVDPARLPENGDPVTVGISARLMKDDGSETTSRAAQFVVKRPAPAVPPASSESGESSPSSTPESSSQPESSGSSGTPDPSSQPESSGSSSTPDPSSQPESSGSSSTPDPSGSSGPSTAEPACHAEPLTVAISGGTDHIDEKTGGSVTYTATADFGAAPDCTLPEHTSGTGRAHGYTVTWSLTGGGDFAQVDSSGKLTVIPEKLPTTEARLTLTATLAKTGELARNSVRTATREIVAARSSICDKEILISVQPSGTDIAFDSDQVRQNLARSVTFQAVLTDKGGSCDFGHDHQTVSWKVDQPGWASVDGNGVVTVHPANLPGQQNELRVTASVVGKGGVPVEATAVLKVIRPMICLRKVTGVTISGGSSFSVAANRVISHIYTAAKTYDSGICDETGHSDTKGHGEGAVSWQLTAGGNAAFTLDQSGKLMVNGSKLEQGKSYDITVTAAVDGKTAEYPVKITCTAPQPESDRDDGSDDREWENLEDKIDDALKGDTIKLDLGSSADVPFYIFDSLRGRDITLQMKAGKGYTWTVNGKSVKKIPPYQIYIPLDIEEYSNSRMEKLCRGSDVKGFRLRHKGSFYADMTLTMDLGQGRASKVLYLYSYDEDSNKLTYCSSAKADGYGVVSFTLTKSLGTYVVTNKALYGESPVTSGGGAVGGSSGITAIYPPTAPASPTPVPPASSSSASESSSDSESSSESSVVVPPASSPEVPVHPTDTPAAPEKSTLPILAPILILCIAGVITATALIVRGSRSRADAEAEEN